MESKSIATNIDLINKLVCTTLPRDTIFYRCADACSDKKSIGKSDYIWCATDLKS